MKTYKSSYGFDFKLSNDWKSVQADISCFKNTIQIFEKKSSKQKLNILFLGQCGDITKGLFKSMLFDTILKDSEFFSIVNKKKNINGKDIDVVCVDREGEDGHKEKFYFCVLQPIMNFVGGLAFNIEDENIDFDKVFEDFLKTLNSEVQ